MNWLGLTIFVLLPAIGAIFAFRSVRLLPLIFFAPALILAVLVGVNKLR